MDHITTAEEMRKLSVDAMTPDEVAAFARTVNEWLRTPVALRTRSASVSCQMGHLGQSVGMLVDAGYTIVSAGPHSFRGWGYSIKVAW